MIKNFNARRHFAIRRQIAKRDENTVVLKNGVRVAITSSNARFAETVRQNSAERAFEDAVFARIAA